MDYWKIVPCLKIHGLVRLPEKLLRFIPMIRVEGYADAWQYAQAAALYFYGVANSTADFFDHIRGVFRRLLKSAKRPLRRPGVNIKFVIATRPFFPPGSPQNSCKTL